ncbi:MAG TPA: hypothetical protein VKM54_19035 [Myxococcota bacterium]|nr:hypothetical protein [Myxococcota bacterium]
MSILSALRSEVTFDQKPGKTLFVHVKQVERGDNPFREDFSVRFRLSSDPPEWDPGSVEATDVPIGVTEVINSEAASGPEAALGADFFFRFNNARSLARNIERFRAFVKNRLSRVDQAHMFSGGPAAVVRPTELLPLPGGDPMPGQREKLAERLWVFAEQLGITVTEVVSLKFRPVMPGAKYIDPFGKPDANAYLYGSEYSAGKRAVTLTVPTQPLGQEIAGTCVHPFPWSSDYQDFIRQFQNTDPPILWVQHETGLEILAAVASVASIIGVALQIWEIMRKEIANNKQVANSDRYYRQVTEVRAEIRYIDHTDRLAQRLIFKQEVTDPISPAMARSEKWIP